MRQWDQDNYDTIIIPHRSIHFFYLPPRANNACNTIFFFLILLNICCRIFLIELNDDYFPWKIPKSFSYQNMCMTAFFAFLCNLHDETMLNIHEIKYAMYSINNHKIVVETAKKMLLTIKTFFLSCCCCGWHGLNF